MKKSLCSFLILCFLFSCIACNTQQTPPNTDTHTASNSETIQPDDATYTMSKCVINDGRPSNGIIENYYIQEFIDLDMQRDISRYASTSNVSDKFSEYYTQSTNIRTIPILGSYLEYTSLQVCMFYTNDTMIGTVAVVLALNDKGIFIKEELETSVGSSYHGSPLADQNCFKALSSCMQNYPDFEIKGVVYNQYGYMAVYPVGLLPGDSSIKYFDYELCDFRLIEPFLTIAEGQNNFTKHWEKRDELISNLPTYKWENTTWRTEGWINKYKYQDVYLLHKELESQYLFDFDWLIAIPLLDADGNEGVYALHLLYHHDTLIAELLLNDAGELLIPKKEIVSEKDSTTQEYIGLSKIDYLDEVTRLLKNLDDNAIVKGIGFDGDNYMIILASE